MDTTFLKAIINIFWIGTASILFYTSISEASRYVPMKSDPGEGRWFERGFSLDEEGLVKSRPRRAPGDPLPFSAEEETLLVDLHNDYRRRVSPEASNMEYMIWDDQLAAWAQEWIDGCYYEHGFPPAADNLAVGQNLWRGFIALQPDGSGPVSSWWNEWRWYDYDTHSCQEGKICTHYTQLVWDTSSKVGCGRSYCAEGYDDTLNFTKNYIVACNYLDQGNKFNIKPYENGTSCTRCSSGVMQCDNKLCRVCQEDETNEECSTTCEVDCKNCGVVNENCTCSCTPQFTGVDCSAPCGNYDESCGKGWPVFLCTGQIPGFEFVLDFCPAMCDLCSVQPNQVLTGCPTAVQHIVNTDNLTADQNAVVTWNEPSSTLPSVSLSSQSHVPGTMFPAGRTPVQYVFTSGAQEVSATCCFDVEVIFTLTEGTTPGGTTTGGTTVEGSTKEGITTEGITAKGTTTEGITTEGTTTYRNTTEGTTTDGTMTEGTTTESTTTDGTTTDGTTTQGTTKEGTMTDETTTDGTTTDGTTIEDTTTEGTTTGGTTTGGTTVEGSTKEGITTEGITAKGTTTEGITTEGTTTYRNTTEGTTTDGTMTEGTTTESTTTDGTTTDGTTTQGTTKEGTMTDETTTDGTTTDRTTIDDTTTEGTTTGGTTTRSLEEILEIGISGYNVNDVTKEVYIITKNKNIITAGDIALVFDILQQIAETNSSDANVTDLIVGIVNNLMDVEEEVLAAAQKNGNFTTLIVQILESQLNTVDIDYGTFETFYTNIAVKVSDLSSDDALEGIVITMFNTADNNDLSDGNIKVESHQDASIETILEDTFARVVVPVEAAHIATKLEVIGGSRSSPATPSRSDLTPTPYQPLSPEGVASTVQSLRIVFVVYAHDAMFPSPTLAQFNRGFEDFNRTVNTPVVSFTIGEQTIENLMEPVNITFSRLMPGSRDPTCNFWEFSLGQWYMTGCQLLPGDTMQKSMEVHDLKDEYYTCACDHLTNFAVLVDIYAVDEPPKASLRVLSIIGCVISCVSLLITLISYIGIKRARGSQTHRVFICLCGTLLCLYIAFLAIVALDTEFESAELEQIPCTILAVIIHYFVLSSLTWMGIEGFNIYLVIIRVFDTYIPRFMIKAAFIGWGIPAVIVGLTGGIARNSYAVEDYCYLQQWPLIGGLLIPMVIILLINVVIFILAMRRLKQSARMAGRVKMDSHIKAQRQETRERIQNGISMMILLGLSWITGYLTLINVDIADILFIVFNSLQGFFIFVLYCVRKATIREQWRRGIRRTVSRKGRYRTGSDRGSRQKPGSTNGTDRHSYPTVELSSSKSHANPSYEH